MAFLTLVLSTENALAKGGTMVCDDITAKTDVVADKGIPMNTPALSTFRKTKRRTDAGIGLVAVLLATMNGSTSDRLFAGIFDCGIISPSHARQSSKAFWPNKSGWSRPSIQRGVKSYRRYDRLPSVPLVPPDRGSCRKDSWAQRIGV